MKNRDLLNEGGAGMHMLHPFDLPSVGTGRDLIEFFYKAADFVSRNPEEIVPSDSTSLKVDGANTSFKLIRSRDGQLEFAFDRGSMKPIDIEGITIDRLTERWAPEHGMVEMGRILLSALNDCLRESDEILEILTSLGLLSEDGKMPISTKYINTEFCWKETNAVKYKEDFIAFHGINQFYEKEWRGVRRPGLIRPLEKDPKTGKMKPIKATASPVPYEEGAMEKFRRIVAPFLRAATGPKNPDGFNLYTVIPVYIKPGLDLVSEVDSKLDTELTIQIRSKNLNEWTVDEATGSVTKSIKDWLLDERCLNPRSHMIRTSEGTSKGAMSKEIYGRVLRGDAVEDILEDPSGWDTPMAINGALFYYSIENVGATILNALTSPLGDLVTKDQAHEGIVLRNKEIFGVDSVKITGNFITAGSQGKFATSPTDRETNEEQGDPVDLENGLHIALIPGAFKPPHRGHLKMVERFSNIEKIDKVLIIISRPLKRSRTLPTGEKINENHAADIWREYIQVSEAEIEKVEILVSDSPSPVTPVIDYTRNEYSPNDKFSAPPGTTVYLGCGDKGDDVKRYDGTVDEKREDLKIQIVTCDLDTKHDPNYMSLMKELPPELKENIPSIRDSGLSEEDFHAKDMRFLISAAKENDIALEMFSDFLPPGVDPHRVLSILGVGRGEGQTQEEPAHDERPTDVDLSETIYNSIYEVILESTPFQTKMKKRLSKAHSWFLDQGRKDLVKYGSPFSTPRPRDKSNAFLAEEIGVYDRAGQIWEPENFPEEELKQIEELSAAGGIGGGGLEGSPGAQNGPWKGFSSKCDHKPKKPKKKRRKKKQVKIRRK